MPHNTDNPSSSKRILYILFAIQITIIGAAITPLWPLIIVGLAISIVSIIHP